VSRTRLTVPDLGVKAPTEEELKRAAAERESARQTHGFASIVGQAPVIQRLRELATLYHAARKTPAHVLLTGIDGIGKRTIARAFALEYCYKYTTTDARALGRAADLMGILTSLGEYDALLIQDIGRIPKSLVDHLRLALREFALDFVTDKGMFAKTVKVPFKRFTCLATARSKTECRPELIEAFPLILPLQSYSQPQLVSICEKLVHEKGITITPPAAALVAGVSADTPHHIEVLVNQLASLGRTTISEEDVNQVSSVLGLSTGSVGSTSPGKTETLSGVDFEKAIAALLRAMGFHTEMTQASGDGGIDIVATLDRLLIGGRYLIQCKRFSPERLVGAATVRDFYGTLTADRRAVKGILITTSGFTSQALAFARELPIELIGGQQLRELLAQYGISIEIQSAPRPLLELE